MCARRVFLAALGLWAASSVWVVGGEPVPYAETYALAPDRAKALELLVPGTEDYFYYHCLYYQQTEQFDKVEPLLQMWVERLGATPRARQIQHRQALLLYQRHPEQTLDYLRRVFNLQFDHQPERRDRAPDLPTRLPDELLDREKLISQTLRHYANLQGFENVALPWLANAPLNREQRRELLSRLEWPDYPNLVELVVRDLQEGVAFGAYPIHSRLLRKQLDDIAARRAELLSNEQFVFTYLAKLRPSADIVWLVDRQQLSDHLDTLLAFVRKLPPTFNSLKAHVLYHRLMLDRALGKYSRETFLEYLSLPRQAPYMNRQFLTRFSDSRVWVNPQADWYPQTLLPPIGDDQALIRSYLAHFFLTDTTYDAFKDFLDEQYLRKVFAETKIVHGLGDTSQWITWLTPSEFQQLKERVDIDFAFTNPEVFPADGAVHLDIYTKNVTTLIVNVFEINAFNYYRENLSEINTDINLDGLTPNWQYTFQYTDPPLRRVARHLELGELIRPGTYVVDLIGNGKSSRAVIRKGRLRYTSRVTEAGQLVQVLDEQNRPQLEASVWLGGKQYAANQQGEILLPFSTQPGRVPIILLHGSVATLESFDHQGEQYELRAGMYVDRESLLRGRKASLGIRAALLLNGRPVDLAMLENVRLTVTSVDLDNVRSTQQIPNFPLHADKDSIHEIQVPARLVSLEVTLSAQVQSLSQNKKIDLTATERFAFNGLDSTDWIACPHLVRSADGYALDVVGRSGEPLTDRPVSLILKHRGIRHPIETTLKTDRAGRIQLGALPDIVTVEARVVGGATRSWNLVGERQQLPAIIHGMAEQVIELPYPTGPETQAALSEHFSLMELRGETLVADYSSAVRAGAGRVRIGPLPPGDYDLWLKQENRHIRLRVSEADAWNGYLLGNQRVLEISPPKVLLVTQCEQHDEALTIQLENMTPETRVHVFAVRYYPAFDEFALWARVGGVEPTWNAFPPALSSYIAGRQLGDEYRYIIDRRYAVKFPGNMLPRPELLLNPWAVRQTQTSIQEAAQGEAFGRAARGLAPTAPAPAAESSAPAVRPLPTLVDNLDFLRDAAAVLWNLRPDDQGRIFVPKAALGEHCFIRVVAVDRHTLIARHVLAPDTPAARLDLRLAHGLDPAQHFVRLKRVSKFNTGDQFVVDDMASTRFEIYDSLAKVYALYQTLSPSPELAEFRFLVDWDTLDSSRKESLYAKYACHELNFYLAQRDPQFFVRVVVPYLRNKKEKQFLDHWLLENDVSGYLSLWHYGQLNTLERILLMRRANFADAVSRELRDILEVTPIDPARWSYLFDTALGMSGLEASGELAATVRLGQEARREALSTELSQLQKSGAAPPGAAGFAFGGGVGGMPGARQGADRKPVQDAPAVAVDGMARNAAEADAAKRAVEEKLDRAAESLRRTMVRERQQYQQLFQPLDATQEWAENHYYHVSREQQTAELVPARRFWAEYAEQGQPKFLSAYFPEASGSLSEMLLALAVLDFPARSPQHQYQSDGSRLTITLGGPALIFHEEVRPATVAPHALPLLVSQHYFRNDDRYEMKGGRRVDKFVTGEFLIQTVYGCQVVVTNPTSATQQADILLQIPRGALPLAGAAPTKTVRVQLDPFSTRTIEYLFYFPFEGTYPHYPVHVAVDEQLVAFAAPSELRAVEKLSEIDRGSWDYVSQQGTNDELLAFLKDRNLLAVDLSRIAWRMRDASLFAAVIDILQRRHVYHPVLWSYSVLHHAPDALRQYLWHSPQFIAECGPYLDSPLVLIDPVERRTFEHLEYKPLINPRAHQLGARRQILNDRLAQQYRQLMDILACRRALDDQDRLTVVYYLLLQDRIEEAAKLFAQIHPENLTTRLQYDYCQAYLDFFQGDLQVARQLVAAYADYPVESWRKKFALIGQQLAEIDTGRSGVVDPLDRDQVQGQLAAAEPSFDLQLQGHQVVITYRNLEELQVNFYEMDIELLFSSNPFVQEFTGRFSYVRPNVSQTLRVPADRTQTTVEIPAALRTRNVLVEVVGAGRSRAVPYYSNSLTVQSSEGYGQLRVLEATSERPLPRVYVKVYARMKDGQVQFYKDGYTDLRGRFDYASLSTNQLDHVERFALLVLSEQHGAVVRELSPPKR